MQKKQFVPCDRMVMLILMGQLFSNASYMLVAPFIPLEFKAKGVSATMIGVFFAAQSIGVLIWSPVVGKTLERVGRTIYLVGGFILMGVCFACFGVCGMINDPTILILVAVTLRLFQGMASASI
jgi:MFS family permease